VNLPTGTNDEFGVVRGKFTGARGPEMPKSATPKLALQAPITGVPCS
jgi:hypothetical protein